MHKIFPGGSLHLGETSLKNQVCPGGSVDYQMVTCDYFKVKTEIRTTKWCAPPQIHPHQQDQLKRRRAVAEERRERRRKPSKICDLLIEPISRDNIHVQGYIDRHLTREFFVPIVTISVGQTTIYAHRPSRITTARPRLSKQE